MAATIFATPGKLYLTPTAVTGSSGTLIDGIEDRSIQTSLDVDARVVWSGVGANAGPRARKMRDDEWRLILPFRQQDTTGLKVALSHLTTDGATMRPNGGTAAGQFAKLPTFALILRPDLTTGKYLYGPNWALTPGSLLAIEHHETGPQLGQLILELVACKPSNATGPAAAWASSATIASLFGLPES